MYKINLKSIEIKDLNGFIYKVEDLPKQIGNVVFVNAPSIEISDLARQLHAGKVVEVSEDELKIITHVVDDNRHYKPFAHVQIVQYLKSLENKNKIKEDNKNG